MSKIFSKKGFVAFSSVALTDGLFFLFTLSVISYFAFLGATQVLVPLGLGILISLSFYFLFAKYFYRYYLLGILSSIAFGVLLIPSNLSNPLAVSVLFLLANLCFYFFLSFKKMVIPFPVFVFLFVEVLNQLGMTVFFGEMSFPKLDPTQNFPRAFSILEGMGIYALLFAGIFFLSSLTNIIFFFCFLGIGILINSSGLEVTKEMVFVSALFYTFFCFPSRNVSSGIANKILSFVVLWILSFLLRDFKIALTTFIPIYFFLEWILGFIILTSYANRKLQLKL